MNKKYEIKIEILDKDYVDNLIIALARQGYAPYLNTIDNVVCFVCNKADLTEVNYEI